MWLFLKNLLFTVLVVGFVAGWVPLVFLRHRAPLWLDWAPHHSAALPLFLAGAALYLACAWLFGAHGRGTPAPFDPPRKLVMRGPYRWVRNPMYLALLLVVLGEVVYFADLTLLLYSVFLASAFQVLVVVVEESALRRRFGAIYSDYCNVTNRWLPKPPRPRLDTAPPFSPGR